MRRLLLLTGVVGLAGFAWLAWGTHRAVAARRILVESRPADRLVGLPWSVLNDAAEGQLEEGLAALNAPGPSPDLRLRRYRGHLRSAEGLLAASLWSRPTQADALARLAAVRWELSPPTTEEAGRSYERMLEHASALAPGSPVLQRRIGKVYLLMGLRDRGLDALRRALELDAGSATDVVADLQGALLTLPELAASLPHSPDVLIALARPFIADGRAGAYADLVERRLEGAPPELISRYGNACLHAGAADRLVKTLTELRAADEAVDAERMRQLSRAHAVQGDADSALRLARRARDLRPDHPVYAENLGDRELAAGDAEAALRSFRAALALRARKPGGRESHARLYAKIGRSEEHLGRPGEAYDTYRLALELDPDEPTAGSRVDRMRRDAGLPGRRDRNDGP